MVDVQNIVNDTDFYGDIHSFLLIHQKKILSNIKKREELKSIIGKGRIGHKWTHKRVDKASNEIINKTYAE